jgi:hypothetical protein
MPRMSSFTPISFLSTSCSFTLICGGRRDHDRIVVGFITTNAFSAYHH